MYVYMYITSRTKEEHGLPPPLEHHERTDSSVFGWNLCPWDVRENTLSIVGSDDIGEEGRMPALRCRCERVLGGTQGVVIDGLLRTAGFVDSPAKHWDHDTKLSMCSARGRIRVHTYAAVWLESSGRFFVLWSRRPETFSTRSTSRMNRAHFRLESG